MSPSFKPGGQPVPRIMIATLALGAVALLPVAAFGQAPEKPARPQVHWQNGPCTASLGTEASINLPVGYKFVGPEDTRKLMEDMGNPSDGSEKGMVFPMNEEWFIVFEYKNVGYIKDDDKTNLDADAMLSAIKSGNEEGNKERRKRGWSTIEIVGWDQKPQYDSSTHNLIWAIRGKDQGGGEEVINYNTRLLGRGGYMSANLVVEPEKLARNVPAYKTLLGYFSFRKGNTYAEFRQGDKIAEYGLAALVTGGAAAVAVKVGLFKKLWKLIIIAVVGIGAGVKKVLNKFRSS
jgi:uncharacterized membrane-anchored protein